MTGAQFADSAAGRVVLGRIGGRPGALLAYRRAFREGQRRQQAGKCTVEVPLPPIATQLREAEADQAAILAGLSAGVRGLTYAPPPLNQPLLSSSDHRAHTDSSSWLSAAWRRWSAWASAWGSR